MDQQAVEALATALDGDDVARTAKQQLRSTEDTSAAFKAWAAESFAFARNTSYAPALLTELGTGTGAARRGGAPRARVCGGSGMRAWLRRA